MTLPLYQLWKSSKTEIIQMPDPSFSLKVTGIESSNSFPSAMQSQLQRRSATLSLKYANMARAELFIDLGKLS
jgi:hypothetical protein